MLPFLPAVVLAEEAAFNVIFFPASSPAVPFLLKLTNSLSLASRKSPRGENRARRAIVRRLLGTGRCSASDIPRPRKAKCHFRWFRTRGLRAEPSESGLPATAASDLRT